MTVSSLWKEIGVTQNLDVTAPVVPWPLQPVQRGTVGSEMPAGIHSTAPGPGLMGLQELVGRNSIQIALSACSSRGTGGTLLCCAFHPFQIPPAVVPIGVNSEMRGRVGVLWDWWDSHLEEDKDTSTRTGNPSHFQAIGSLSLFPNYYYMLQNRKWHEAHSSWLFCI